MFLYQVIISSFDTPRGFRFGSSSSPSEFITRKVGILGRSVGLMKLISVVNLLLTAPGNCTLHNISPRSPAFPVFVILVTYRSEPGRWEMLLHRRGTRVRATRGLRAKRPRRFNDMVGMNDLGGWRCMIEGQISWRASFLGISLNDGGEMGNAEEGGWLRPRRHARSPRITDPLRSRADMITWCIHI